MFHMHSKRMLVGSVLLLLFLLAACTSTNASVAKNSTPTPTIKATVVTARSVQGTPGTGPIVVTTPTPVPGGNANSQQVVLNDRVLILNNVSKQDAGNGESLITLTLTVKNTSDAPILNQPDFFTLITREGDAFTNQANGSDSFYGNVSVQSSSDGTVTFQIPQGAASGLRLRYRPEVESETVLVSLNV